MCVFVCVFACACVSVFVCAHAYVPGKGTFVLVPCGESQACCRIGSLTPFSCGFSTQFPTEERAPPLVLVPLRIKGMRGGKKNWDSVCECV